MSRMSLDELLVQLLNHKNGTPSNVSDEELQDATVELVGELFEVGNKVLSKMSYDKLAALFSLVQTGVLTAAISQGNLGVAVLANTEEFYDAVIWAVQATAGILTMEEVR